jgi:hypothetical protein
VWGELLLHLLQAALDVLQQLPHAALYAAACLLLQVLLLVLMRVLLLV